MLPRITCVCDRWWGDVLPSCKIPGSDVSPPFDTCPQDHIMNLPNMERARGGVARVELFRSRRRGREGERGVGAFGGRCRPRWRCWCRHDRGCRRARLRSARVSHGRGVGGSTADVDEKIVYVSSGVGSFCTFADATDAVAFDRKMAVALQTPSRTSASRWWSRGEAGRRRDARVPRRVRRAARRRAGPDSGRAMRERYARDPRSFEARFDRRSPVGGEKRARRVAREAFERSMIQ